VRLFPILIEVREWSAEMMMARPEPARSSGVAKEDVLKYAREVFGNPRKEFSWLNTPNHLFNGMRPKDLLELGESEDICSVLNELQRIDHGLF
jgi:uncharacterized protein (DUF2384 family)